MKEDNAENINRYITYQKPLVDENEINKLLHQAYEILHPEIPDKYRVKLYYTYQQPIRSFLY